MEDKKVRDALSRYFTTLTVSGVSSEETRKARADYFQAVEESRNSSE